MFSHQGYLAFPDSILYEVVPQLHVLQNKKKRPFGNMHEPKLHGSISRDGFWENCNYKLWLLSFPQCSNVTIKRSEDTLLKITMP